MASDSRDKSAERIGDGVEMPRPTVAPLVVCVGITLLAAGVVLGLTFLIVGGVLLAFGLGRWVQAMLPGRGHMVEPFVDRRPVPVEGTVGTVMHLGPGVPGYRMRLPVRMHPFSAGLKGGIVGGLCMPVPALLYGVISGHGIWFPINLLAGMVLPGVEETKLGEFHPTLFVVGLVIHATISFVLGLIYGVLLPALPEIPKATVWSGLLVPLLWSAASVGLMWFINPVLQEHVDWPWFVASQFMFGLCVALMVEVYQARLGLFKASVLGGVLGGVLMPLPALMWALANRHGVWYPANLLAGMLMPGVGEASVDELEVFHPGWAMAALALHVLMSLGLSAAFGLLLPKLPGIPGPLATGGLLMPLAWTGLAYGLMGIINPVLEKYVDWPWFIASQFLFGVVAAVVVVRSEQVEIPPAGTGSEDTGSEDTGSEDTGPSEGPATVRQQDETMKD